jgi:hypothetical protein
MRADNWKCNTDATPEMPFEPGKSGNPAGKLKGTRNKTTLAVEALLDGEACAASASVMPSCLTAKGVIAGACQQT